MKTNFKSILAVPFIFLLSFSACKKEKEENTVAEPELPAITVRFDIMSPQMFYANDGSNIFAPDDDGSFSYAWSCEGSIQPELRHYDAEGNLVFAKVIAADYYEALALENAPGGGYVLLLDNRNQQRTELRKLNASGDSVWMWSAPRLSSRSDIAVAPSGNICLASFRDSKACFLLFSPHGDSLACHFISDSLPTYPVFHRVFFTPSGNIRVCYNYPDGDSRRSCIAEYAPDGSQLWSHTPSTPGAISGLSLLTDGSMIGMMQGNDIRFVKYSSQGASLFEIAKPDAGGIGFPLQLSDGNYLLATTGLLMKTDAAGNTIWSQNYTDMINNYIECKWLSEHTPGVYTFYGWRYIPGGRKIVVLRFSLS